MGPVQGIEILGQSSKLKVVASDVAELGRQYGFELGGQQRHPGRDGLHKRSMARERPPFTMLPTAPPCPATLSRMTCSWLPSRVADGSVRRRDYSPESADLESGARLPARTLRMLRYPCRVGGGPVGCEMSQALHALGAEETTVLTDSDRLLPRHEPFAGELVAKSFRESGIDVRLGRLARLVERPVAGGPVTVHADDGSRIEADEVLVAAGRRANVGDIGLGTVTPESGGPVPRGPLQVDSSMRATGVPGGWLYAVGDANGRNLLTHMGKYQARVCADVIAAHAKGLPEEGPALRDTADDLGAPQAIFTDPQVCAAGRTESRARAEGFPVRTVEYDMAAVAGAALQADGYTGRVKAVVDEDRRTLLGLTLVGPAVVDHLHAATIAVTAQVPLDRLWHAVPAFPTVSEFWLELLKAYGL